jgi:hypothetical protein
MLRLCSAHLWIRKFFFFSVSAEIKGVVDVCVLIFQSQVFLFEWTFECWV